MSVRRAIVGAADHGGRTILVTVAKDGTFVDRREIDLVEAGLPRHPHHHEGQRLSRREGVKLVERARASADRKAREGLEALAAAVPARIVAIAIRKCPELPPTIAERIADYRAQCVADSVMYRHALADAASSRGWSVDWYDARSVFVEAARALDLKTIDPHLAEVGRSLGPPWRKDHKIAIAAALARSHSMGSRVRTSVRTASSTRA